MLGVDFSLVFRHAQGSSQRFEHSAEVHREASSDGEENLAIELIAELQKGLSWSEHVDQLPPIPDLLKSPPSTINDITDLVSGFNIPSIWMEIHNTVVDIGFLLAQAKAYKSVEPRPEESSRAATQRRFYAHFEKMYRLNLAVFNLAKIQDLVVRLLFEALGRQKLISVDFSDDDWEKLLTMKAARRGLRAQLTSSQLPQMEHDRIVAALDIPGSSAHQQMFVDYRNRVAHRIRPSVDYVELYSHLQDHAGKPIYDQHGMEKGREYAIREPRNPQFSFDSLYDSTVDYFKHVLEMLAQLKGISRLQ